MLRLPGMTIHLVLESSSVFTSRNLESWPVVTLSPICWRSLVLLNSSRLRDLTTSSTNFSSHMVTESVKEGSKPCALSLMTSMTILMSLKVRQLLLPSMTMKSLSTLRMLSMFLDLVNRRRWTVMY